MNYKELSKEQRIGYAYWLENMRILFDDFQLRLPDHQSLGILYHQGKTVWDVFCEMKNQTAH